MIKHSLRNISIRLRIALIIFTILFIGLIVLSNVLGRILKHDFETLLADKQQFATTMVAEHIDEKLTRRANALKNLAFALKPYLNATRSIIQEQIEDQHLTYSLFDAGIFYCAFDRQLDAIGTKEWTLCDTVLQNEEAIAIVKNDRATIGELLWEGDRARASFMIAVPSYDEKEQTHGFLVGVNSLGLDGILGRWAARSQPQAGEFLIVSNQSKLVISAGNEAHFLSKLGDLSPIVVSKNSLLNSHGEIVFGDFASTPSVMSIKRSETAGWSVISVVPLGDALAPVVQIHHLLLAGILILTFIVILAVWFTLKFQLSPLTTTVKDIDDISHNRKPFAFLPVKSQDEVGKLIVSFNQLLKKLDEREEQLNKNEIFSHAILNSVPVEIAVLDQDGVILSVNQPWQAFQEKYVDQPLGAGPNSGVGVNYLAVCKRSIEVNQNSDAVLVLEGITAVLEGRLPRFSLEYKCASSTGLHWFDLVVTPLNHHNSGAVVSHTDITQRKQIEEALYIAWTSAQAALDAIFWLDKNAKIVGINLAASKLLGYSEVELLQLSLVDISPESSFDRSKWNQYFMRLKNDGAIKTELQLRGQSGRTIAVEVNSTYVHYEHKELICAFVRDITDRKRQELALRFAKAEADKANHAKSKFLAAASHDLRQPLSALALYVDLLSQYKRPRIQDVVRNIHGCVESMSELLTDLLDISKLEAGVVHPVNTFFSVDQLLQKLIDMFSPESNIKGLHLRLRPSNLMANSDQKLFFRVIGNLISNAIRYTETGGILLACRQRGGKYYIEVFDTGIGIAHDEIELIFEEFKQLGDDSRHRGSGLGLAIVKKITNLMGLSIQVQSRLGRGSVFRVEIPIVVDAIHYQDFSVEKSPEGVLIAVVDDQVKILHALKMTLERNGYQVVCGTNGQTVLASLAGRIPHLVISDFRLKKGENGFDVINLIRQKLNPQVAAILMTGDTDPHSIRMMQDSGIAIIYKPLQFKQLNALIAKLLQAG